MFWKRTPAATVEVVAEIEAAARLPPPTRPMSSLFGMLGVNTKCRAKENALAYQSPMLSIHDSSQQFLTGSDKTTGLPLVRSDTLNRQPPSMVTRLVLRNLYGSHIETLSWWEQQTTVEEKRLLRLVPHSVGQWKRAVAAVRRRWGCRHRRWRTVE